MTAIIQGRTSNSIKDRYDLIIKKINRPGDPNNDRYYIAAEIQRLVADEMLLGPGRKLEAEEEEHEFEEEEVPSPFLVEEQFPSIKPIQTGKVAK